MHFFVVVQQSNGSSLHIFSQTDYESRGTQKYVSVTFTYLFTNTFTKLFTKLTITKFYKQEEEEVSARKFQTEGGDIFQAPICR